MIKHTIQSIKKLGIGFLFFVLAGSVCANRQGLGQVAGNLMTPVDVVSSFMAGGAIILGMASIFASFIRYMQHRVNPLAQPISTVITLFILGVLLLLLPFIYKFTDSGIPFSLG